MNRVLGSLIAVVCVCITPVVAHAQDGDSDQSTERDSVESEFEALKEEVSADADDVGDQEESDETPSSGQATEGSETESFDEGGSDDSVPPGQTTEESETGSSDTGDSDTGDSDTDASDTEPTDEDIDELEAALAEDEEEREGGGGGQSGGAVQSMNPDISLILDTTFAYFSSDDTDLRGGHDPNSFGFNLQGLELSIGAAVDPYFRFDSAILFALFGVEIEEAYVTTLAMPWKLQIRAGQFKTKIGRLNPTHLHSWHFVTQPLVNAKFFGGESLRGLGFEISRLMPTPWFSELLLSVQNIGGAATGRSFAPTQDDIDGPLDLTLNTRFEQFFEVSPNFDILWGLGWAVGQNHTGRRNFTDIYETDLLLRWRDATEGGRNELGWQTEFMWRRRQVPQDVLQDWGGQSFVYYSPSKYFEFATRYELVSGIDPDDDNRVDPLDPEWTDLRHRGAINASWMPSHFSRLRLEYQADYLSYREDTDLDALDHQVFLQLEVVTGAHGTHDY
jgi:hypothetical protein